MKRNIKHVTFCLFLIASALYCNAQKTPHQPHVRAIYDTAYYESFLFDIVARFYFSQKFTTIRMKGIDKGEKLNYIPNTNLNMGVGVTYKPLTINLGFGFGFLNHDAEKGKTKYVDLQSHLYLRKYVFDLTAQFYKGFYLPTSDYTPPPLFQYYRRPDMRVQLVGLSAYQVFNYKKFSYRAAMVQNEWQKKSAGSLVAGIEAYYGANRADSAFVPHIYDSKYNQSGVDRVHFFEVGPGVGYAYTLVIARHFFVTASLTVNPKVSFTTERVNGSNSDVHVSVVPGYFGRGAIGYNSDIWNVNVSFVGNRVFTKGPSSSDSYAYTTSNIRLTYARHLVPGPKVRKSLNTFDKHFQRNMPIQLEGMPKKQ